MALELYQEISLTCYLPEHHLRTGNVATIVDFVAHPSESEVGCVLELFNAVGESISVVAVPQSVVAALRSDEILTIRP